MLATRSSLVLLAVTLAGAGTAVVQAQDLPATQPNLITIYRETVKPGRAEEHARLEAGWPAAYGRANSTDYYLGMSSLTGIPEAWFISPWASHAAQGESMKRDDANATLSAELARLSRADAELLENTRVIQAVARPDLSWGRYPDLARQRFWEITIFRVRPGHEDGFDAAAKAYAAASQRGGSTTGFRTYQVIAGMLGPTYIVFSSVENFADFDRVLADGMKTMQGFTADEMTVMQKFSREGMLSAETNRFRLDPRMSYVSAATRATDPAFWNPRPAPRRPASGGQD
jgi:hypothetical protein